jgi:predicted nucleic acid-binding protein
VKPVVLDTSVVIRFLDAAHPGHAEAVDLLADIDARLVIHDLNLAELLVGGFMVGRPDELLRTVTDDMAVEPWDESGASWALHLARVRAEAKPRLKTPDAVVLATALRLGGLVATFDQRLEQAAEAEGCYYRPPRPSAET